MIVDGVPAGLHLTYCTNIHPGESWPQVFQNLATHVVAVKARVSPTRPFGVGLRLSAAAANALEAPEALDELRSFLRANDLYVFTINGFPYGAFHGERVKENVYRPDWLEEARVVYSAQLARILAALLPPDLEGSVSTVPGCFRQRATSAQAASLIADRIRRQALDLWQLRERTGRIIGLALEPEPECILETTADAVAFFEQHLFSRASTDAFAQESGLSRAQAEESLHQHLGICLDACHAAVEFEDPTEAVARAKAAGLRILKIQVSAGLTVPQPSNPASMAALARFADDVYLHQVVIRTGDQLSRHVDLPEALAAGAHGDEWRVHFHVPLFRDRLGPFVNTQPFLKELLPLAARTAATQHLEVETYTWDVLPEEYRREPVVDAIARELSWTLAQVSP